MQDVRRLVQQRESEAGLSSGLGDEDGKEERFEGYGVMAAPFRSGDVLALRRFHASSIGPGYLSVWHRSPDGQWTFWSDQPAASSCPRYFGNAIATAIHTEIALAWDSPVSFVVRIPSARLDWSVHLASTVSTRMLNGVAAALPRTWWRNRRLLGAIAHVAAPLLGAGRMALTGRVPNGQYFSVNPLRIWAIDRTTATLSGKTFGQPGPLPEQARLGDFWLPQRGLFAIGRAFFAP